MFNNIPTYARFQWINHPLVRKTIEKLLPSPKKGRKGYDKTTMFLWLMYKKVMRCTYRKFRKRLVEKDWFVSVFENFSHQFMGHFRKVLLLIDSSFVETFSKHEENGSAYSGYKEKEGFKFHALLDFYSRLPLMQEATDGVTADVKVGEVLIRGAPRDLPVEGFAGDKGYDSESFACEIHRKWKKAKIVIPMRRMKHDGNEKNRRERGAYRTRDLLSSTGSAPRSSGTSHERNMSSVLVKNGLDTSRISVPIVTLRVSWKFLSGRRRRGWSSRRGEGGGIIHRALGVAA